MAALRYPAIVALLSLVAAACGGSGGGSTQAAAVPHHALQPGDLALDYVTSREFTSLVVEVDAFEGAVPSEVALERLAEVLQERLDKPAGVEVVLSSEIPVTRRREAYRSQDIRELEAEFRDFWSGDARAPARAVIWVVYLPGAGGRTEGGDYALGLTLGASELAVFPEVIAWTTAPEARDAAEALVLVHEVGHLLGLVNNGIPAVDAHEDPFHPRHDVSPDCVMYHEIETGSLGGAIDLAEIDYGYGCRLDLFSVGGKDPGQPDEPAVAGLPR
jgi:hypothetical protein